MDATLESRLKKALAGRAAVDMGQFEFLNLDMVRAEAGDKWIEVRKKIYSVSTHFVEKRLHPDDVLLRCRGGFILIFAHLTAAESRARVALISAELNKFYLGDQILSDLEIRAEAKSVSAAEFAQILQMTTKPRAETAAPASPAAAEWRQEQAATGKPAANWAKAAGEARSSEGTAWTPEGGAAGSAAGTWASREADPISGANAAWKSGDPARSGASGGRGVHHLAADPVRQDRRQQSTSGEAQPASGPGKSGWREAVAAESEGSGSGHPDAVFTDPATHWDDIIFKPFWDAKLGVISANLCLARRVRNGRARYGRDTLMGNESKSLHLQLDRTVAVAAQRGFQQMFSQGGTCAIAIPVHYDTVRNVHERVAYFSILQSVPQHLRKYFYLRVDGIPEGAPLGQMQEIFRSMKCFGSNLLAKIPLGFTNVRAFEGCRIDLFGSEVPERASVSGLKDDEIESLARRTTTCKDMSAGSFLTQVSSFELLNVGISIGIRYFSGSAIGPETPLPVPIVPLSFADLHQRNQERLRQDRTQASA